MKLYKHVVLEAPSRLAFTLINLGLGFDRINGGAGVALANPSFKCLVEPASDLSIECADGHFVYTSEVEGFLNRLLDHLRCPPVHVTVHRQIPSHSGFGSKTATLLGVGRAVAVLYNLNISTPELARIAHRARTSGIGANTFDRGGFVVDGGHPIDTDSSNRSDIFMPTRFSEMRSIPSVLFHRPFLWPICIILPFGDRFEGITELDHFRTICPIPTESVYEIAHIVCFRMTSAIVENDYTRFCRAVNDLQKAYWKANQIKLQTQEVRFVLENALTNGFDAIGISSNGPALYGLSSRSEAASCWLDKLRQNRIVHSYWFTHVPNQGFFQEDICGSSRHR